jgi:hypothetical protein
MLTVFFMTECANSSIIGVMHKIEHGSFDRQTSVKQQKELINGGFIYEDRQHDMCISLTLRYVRLSEH